MNILIKKIYLMILYSLSFAPNEDNKNQNIRTFSNDKEKKDSVITSTFLDNKNQTTSTFSDSKEKDSLSNTEGSWLEHSTPKEFYTGVINLCNTNVIDWTDIVKNSTNSWFYAYRDDMNDKQKLDYVTSLNHCDINHIQFDKDRIRQFLEEEGLVFFKNKLKLEIFNILFR